VIKNLEVACRYGTYNTPFNSLWGNNLTQLDYGVNYWINWRTVVRVSYEVIDSKITSNTLLSSNPDRVKTSGLHFQFSIQL
jgi:hypothetical protein